MSDPRHVRACFTVISQQAAVFAGSIRQNLQPRSVTRACAGQLMYKKSTSDNPDYQSLPSEDEPTSSDVRLWDAITNCGLRERVVDLGGLDGKVEDAGSNLSSGERQLLW